MIKARILTTELRGDFSLRTSASSAVEFLRFFHFFYDFSRKTLDTFFRFLKMKKIVLLAVFGLVAVSVGVMAQAKPFIGYDKVAWGVSEKDVRKAYGFGADIIAVVDEEDSNIITMSQKNVSDSIKERDFMFNGDKLYRVYVTYKDPSDTNRENLKSVLVSRYGNQTNYDIKRDSVTAAFQKFDYTLETYTFGKFGPDIEVELQQRMFYAGYENDTKNLLGGNSLIVMFTWKKFRDEYQASKLGL
jgi:hypothetical protein